MAPSHVSDAPFPSVVALNTERLDLSQSGLHNRIPECSPSETTHELVSYVPGEPTINLVDAEVHLFISQELNTQVLDELYERLWLVIHYINKL
jgi:hypothetical protein